MYEMYPEAWPIVGERRRQVEQERPRRRARTEHSVLPPALTAAGQPTQAPSGR